MTAEAPSGFEVFGIISCTRILHLASQRLVGTYGSSQATHTSSNMSDNQVEARELKTDTAAPAWEQSSKDPMKQPLAGSCRAAAG